MKKILFVLTLVISMFFICCTSANADIMPYYVESINKESIGVYQADKLVTVYQKPDENSPVLVTANRHNNNFYSEINIADMFVVLNQSKNLAFILATDDYDGWVEVIYDQKKNLKGWVKKADEFQFLPWRNFYNLYGKKYGLYLMKNTKEAQRELHSASASASQVVDRINLPKLIKLTIVRGNWALVSVLDYDKRPKTGYLQWRSIDGTIYAFPDIK